MSEENEMMNDSFLSADIEVEDPAVGSIYPVVQWLNGSKKRSKEGGVAYHGGFFLAGDQGIEPPPGFEPFTLVTDDGTEVPGFACTEITFSPIRQRRCWMASAPNEGGLSQRFGWDEYEEASAFSGGGVRGVAHLLVGLPNFDEPVLLTFSGMTARAMLGQGRSNRGVIPTYKVKVPRAATRIAKKKGLNKKYPDCAFVLTVGGELEEDGKSPKFTKVGSGQNTSMVTYPAWRDEPASLVDEKTLAKLYVGNQRLAQYQSWHTEADAWVAQWNSDELAARANRTQAPAANESAEGGLPGAQEAPF